MAFTVEHEIQRLVRDPILPADLADAVLAGNNQIQSVSGFELSAWSEGDIHYGPLVTIGALWGAYTILMGWDKDQYLDKAKQLLSSYETAVKHFKELPVSDNQVSSQLEDNIVVSEYGIHALNEDIPHYLSDY